MPTVLSYSAQHPRIMQRDPIYMLYLTEANFELVDSPAPPPPQDGEVLVRTLALTIGAGQRAGLQGSASYAGAATSNTVMGGTGVGRVLASRHPGALGRPVRYSVGPVCWWVVRLPGPAS